MRTIILYALRNGPAVVLAMVVGRRLRDTTRTNTNAPFPPTSIITMSMEESISLEETNKIRISLGLKPLTDDKASAADDKEKQAEDNYAKQRERDAKDREAK